MAQPVATGGLQRTPAPAGPFRPLFLVVALLLGLMLAEPPSLVFADSAPLIPTARGLKPLQDTAVRMAEEQVDIRVVPSDEDRTPYKALVSVTFRFEADASEAIKVGFPLSWFPTESQGPSDMLRDFQVKVEGRPVAWSQAPVEGGTWAVWDQSFAAGRPSLTQVTYTMLVEMARWPVMEVQYILQTGVHWKGPIGRARVRVEFPFALDPSSVESSLPVQVAGNAALWQATNFEPRENFWVRVPCRDRVDALAADFGRAQTGDVEALGRCLGDIEVCERFLRPDAGTVLLGKVAEMGLGADTTAGGLFIFEVQHRLAQGQALPEAWIRHYLVQAAAALTRSPEAHRAPGVLVSCLALGRAGLDREHFSGLIDEAVAAALVALCARDRLEVKVPASAEERWWRPWASGVRVRCGPGQLEAAGVRAFLEGVARASPDIRSFLQQDEAGISMGDLPALVARAAPRAAARVPVRLVWSYGRYGPPQRTNGTVFEELGEVRYVAQGPEAWEFAAECRRVHAGFWAGVGAGLIALAAGVLVARAGRRRRRLRAQAGCGAGSPQPRPD